MAKGWGPGTRERQHASCDIIPERWGERTHPRTQAQLTLNRSALAAVRFQLPTLTSGVGKKNCTLDISTATASKEAVARRSLLIPPYLLLLFLVHVFVSVQGVRMSYTYYCVYRVSSRYLVCPSATSATSMVCV